MNQNRVHAGVPAGGEFAAHDRTEADLSLTPAPRVVSVNFTTKIEHFEVPEYPTGLPQPDVYFELDAGDVELTVTLDGNPYTFGVHENGDQWDSITEPRFGDNDDEDVDYFGAQIDAGEDEEKVAELRDAFIEWGTDLRNSLDAAAYGLQVDAVEQVRSEILAVATGFDQYRPNLAERSTKLSRAYAELGAELGRVSAAQVARGILETYPAAATVELFNYEDDRRWSGFAVTDAEGNSVADEGELEDLWEHWQEEINEIPTSAPVVYTDGAWLPDEKRFTWLTSAPGAKSATIDLRAAAAQELD